MENMKICFICQDETPFKDHICGSCYACNDYTIMKYTERENCDISDLKDEPDKFLDYKKKFDSVRHARAQKRR